MTLEELLKSLGLDTEEGKDKASILKKEFNSKTKEVNELTKKLTKLEETGEATKGKEEKLGIIAKAFNLDIDAEDLDAMIEEVKESLVKEAGGGTTPEEIKNLKRDLTKISRERDKVNETLAGVTEQLNNEKTQRINQTKSASIRKALEANKIIKPDQMVDLFFNKVIVDEDGTTLTIKGQDGSELTINDAVADFAKENPEFVVAGAKGGVGSGFNTGNAKQAPGEVDGFMKQVLQNRTPAGAEGSKSLFEQFGQ
jgi:hypothetical protein